MVHAQQEARRRRRRASASQPTSWTLLPKDKRCELPRLHLRLCHQIPTGPYHGHARLCVRTQTPPCSSQRNRRGRDLRCRLPERTTVRVPRSRRRRRTDPAKKKGKEERSRSGSFTHRKGGRSNRILGKRRRTGMSMRRSQCQGRTSHVIPPPRLLVHLQLRLSLLRQQRLAYRRCTLIKAKRRISSRRPKP